MLHVPQKDAINGQGLTLKVTLLLEASELSSGACFDVVPLGM